MRVCETWVLREGIIVKCALICLFNLEIPVFVKTRKMRDCWREEGDHTLGRGEKFGACLHDMDLTFLSNMECRG